MKNADELLRRCIAFVSVIAVMFAAAGIRPMRTSSLEMTDEYMAQLAKDLAIVINEARVENGVAPLYSAPTLYQSSAVRAAECAQLWDHKRPDGTNYSTAIDTSLVNKNCSAENIAAGSSTVDATFKQWQNSSRHWSAILNENYTHIGVGVCYDPASQYRWYWEILLVGCDGGIEGQYIPVENEIVPKACGDLNGDGMVNTYDYLTLTDYLGRKDESPLPLMNDLQIEAADCFKDGQVNVNDAKALQRFLLGEYKKLPFVF